MNTQAIQSIETKYKGYRFRSRTEARWGIFFDAMGIEWEYEKEGYDLQSGKYLPDFWLPQVSKWAEVKAVVLSRQELMLCEQLSRKTSNPVLMLVGVPDAKLYPAISSSEYEHGGWMVQVDYHDIQEPHGYWISEKRFYHDHQDSVDFGCDYQLPEPAVPDELWQRLIFGAMNCQPVDPDERAISAARSARFEHGESPQIPSRFETLGPEPTITELQAMIDRKRAEQGIKPEAEPRKLICPK